jgi:D-threonine aldolase
LTRDNGEPLRTAHDEQTVVLPRMSDPSTAWYGVTNIDEVPSPGLLVYPDRVEQNLDRMISLAGDVERLRPHIKTHKLAEVTQMQLARGVTRFKCATIAEAEMAADCGAADVLLAYQPVGPNVGRLLELIRRFPSARFLVIVDDEGCLQALSKSCCQSRLKVEVLLDVDCGMHRTGVEPGERAGQLYALMERLPGLIAGGLHAYDGHIHDTDLTARTRRCDEAFALVAELQARLRQAGSAVPRLIAGGTPTFPIHARRADVECSPGTCVFWDAGYGSKLPDLEFLEAALVLTRVVSKPGPRLLCLDLGHKAIASENPPPRVRFLDLAGYRAVTHSEEHLVIETDEAGRFAVGDCLLGVPWHICPTVALHSEVIVVRNRRAQARWRTVARDRRLTV